VLVEGALTLEDYWVRRSGRAWFDLNGGIATLAPAADAMAPLLGWSDARIADEIASCRRIQETNMAGLREVARTMPDRHDTGAFADTRPHAARIPDPSSPN